MSETSLNAQFAALHAHRVATMNPTDLAVNIRQREYLVQHARPETFPRLGQSFPDFSLPEVDGGLAELPALLARGPVVVIFFRFAGCPACNIALPYYQRALWPGLAQAGGSLVAISPQEPDRLREIKTRHALPFLVATDRGNALARRLGITFLPTAEAQANAEAKGVNISEITGTGTWELPMPAVFVIGQNGILRFADVSPDWLVRTEAGEILAALAQPAGV